MAVATSTTFRIDQSQLDAVVQHLGLQMPVHISFGTLFEAKAMLLDNRATMGHRIKIDPYYAEDAEDASISLLHELMHAAQFERGEYLDEYIDIEDDPEAYWHQPCEVEARTFSIAYAAEYPVVVDHS